MRFSCENSNFLYFIVLGIKNARKTQAISKNLKSRPELTLARLHARVLFIDHVNATAATDHAVVTISGLQCLQRIYDFHVKTLV